jgi:hypothetical protein
MRAGSFRESLCIVTNASTAMSLLCSTLLVKLLNTLHLGLPVENDFSILDDLTDEDVEAFRKLKGAVLIEGSSLGQNVVLATSRGQAKQFPWAVSYLPEEIKFLRNLPGNKAKLIHDMKVKAGGNFEIEKVNYVG